MLRMVHSPALFPECLSTMPRFCVPHMALYPGQEVSQNNAHSYAVSHHSIAAQTSALLAQFGPVRTNPDQKIAICRGRACRHRPRGGVHSHVSHAGMCVRASARVVCAILQVRPVSHSNVCVFIFACRVCEWHCQTYFLCRYCVFSFLRAQRVDFMFRCISNACMCLFFVICDA